MALEILTATLVLVTASYAISTFRLVKANEEMAEQMKAQMEELNRPLVTATILTEPDNPILYLLIANRGRSAARNLRLRLNKSFQQFGRTGESENISKFPAFTGEIESFPPGSELIFCLAQGFLIFAEESEQEDLPWQFSVTTHYTFGHKEFSEEHCIDLSGYRSSVLPQDPVVRKLKDIAQQLEKIVKHHKDGS